MQINNLGFPANLFGIGSAAPTAGTGFAQSLGQVLGTPNADAGAGLVPPPAANDSVAPAATMRMAQLLTTAAPLAPTVPAAIAMPEAQLPAAPAVAGDAATLPETAVATPQAPGKPIVQDKPGAPAKPDAMPATLELPADPAPEAPVPDATAEPAAEEAKGAIPAKRGTRLAKNIAEEIPADPAAADAQPVVAEIVAVAAVQAPVRPELAVKPQASPSRLVGDVTANARKADPGRAEPAAAQPAATADKGDAAVSAIAGKAGDKNDNAPSDERGQAPAFTLRHDGHATPAHAATETTRTQAAPAVAAAEPVVAARPGHLGQQLGVEIARKVETGEDTLRVRLSPDNLGKVEVTLSFDDGGKLHATVRAESAQALDLLRQDAPDLGRALDQAGIRADAQSFRFESRSDGGGAQAQQQGQNPSAGGQHAGSDETDTTETAYREIRGDGQVDLLA
ncbi:flagellar hook-length control protein FliK [Sphingomonas sp. HITSZ_GF]|uniref:flagellar hook-length control protein FliK n=1 Tax=Sphingomonas sp. HITSZ_GF TaxID=3037247 RepID=UPI00240DAFFA|nr:flagellar hook-length control protein FliK [Sphingomonas sp. HITSZ_GF]MDG2534029.1 flagellar hook-length control protein FliK [Sphingomonas sp. HITSZ_GF]